jgi:preprotein translocase subunit SecE
VADKKETRKRSNSIQRFFRETIGELKKVSWPSWPEARRLTWIVVLVMVFMAVFLGAFDFLASKIFDLILGIS